MKCNKDCFNCKFDDCIISLKGAASDATTRPYVKRDIKAKDPNEYNRIYYALYGKDKQHEQQKQYREAHRKEIQDYQRSYYQRRKGEKCSADRVEAK